jgi:hypothetical protein
MTRCLSGFRQSNFARVVKPMVTVGELTGGPRDDVGSVR